MNKKVVIVDEAPKALGISRTSLYRYVLEGMPYEKIDGHRYFNVKECKAWMQANRHRIVSMKSNKPSKKR